ncbi:MAG: dTDP-4-dehydrorhamnose reductase [Gammaproteobacteria bacterium]|nr:dTDP-4-dehydrorhamnose reductase [Gammaproteobacteria bacterium]
MRALIFGAGGQLGSELQRSVPTLWQVVGLAKSDVDICSRASVSAAVTAWHPKVIINTAAYTKVDKAEQESDLAFAVNMNGAAYVAEAASEHAARLIHVSTDFVFDGNKSTPYKPGDPEQPLNVYGASKLAGDQQVLRFRTEGTVVLRTAWVYSSHGANFVKTMLRLMREHGEIRVVADQFGTPTWARTLAEVIWRLADRPDIAGLQQWTNSGTASWYDFAVAIQEEALEIGLLESAVPIIPIATDEYPTPARRPAYSVLDKSSLCKLLEIIPPHWRVSLRAMLKELRDHE